MTTFRVEIDQFLTKVNGNLDKLAVAYGLEIYSQIKIKTPVDTGFARASWYALVNQSDGAHPAQPVKTQGKNSVSDNNAGTVELLKAKWGDRVTIANNAEYIQRLEEGSSQQAPQGMVVTTLNDAELILQDVLKRFTR